MVDLVLALLGLSLVALLAGVIDRFLPDAWVARVLESIR